MSQVFISYARSTEDQAQLLAKALRAAGYDVWLDDALPAHRLYSDVIEERLREAKAVVVIWSADAVKSQWVRAEADFARNAGTLVQLSIDGAIPPLPFNQIHCSQLKAWEGDPAASCWRNVLASVADLVAGVLQAPASPGPTLPAKPSIAVLPFANLSNDADQDYFVEGMMEEIVTALTRIRALFVISSESSLALKGQALNDQQAAARMGVRYLLEGSVRRAGARVRIGVKLVDTGRSAQIWAERFDDTLDDVFELQDRIALKVAGIIEPSVHEAEVQRAVRQPLESAGCYDLYLRAAPLRTVCRKDEVMHALKLLERAISLDADFAPALAQAAGCHSQIFCNGWAEDRKWHRSEGLALAERAIKAGSEDAAVLAQAANAVMELDYDITRAAALADRATALNPGSARAWFISGVLRLVEGDGDRAVEHLETAARLDPISPLNDIIRTHIAMGRILQGDCEDALRLVSATTHRSARVRLVLAALYGHLGRPAESREELAQFQSGCSMAVEDAIATLTQRAEMRIWVRDGLLAGQAPLAT